MVAMLARRNFFITGPLLQDWQRPILHCALSPVLAVASLNISVMFRKGSILMNGEFLPFSASAGLPKAKIYQRQFPICEVFYAKSQI
jgi:hypothetical protein